MARMLKLYGSYVKSLWLKLLSVSERVSRSFTLLKIKYIYIFDDKKLRKNPSLSIHRFLDNKKIGKTFRSPKIALLSF